MFSITMLGHPRSDGDPGIAWLRKVLVEICHEIDKAYHVGRESRFPAR